MPLLTTQSAKSYGFGLFSITGNSHFESISTVTVSSSTGSVTFSSIPSGFQHLHLRINARIVNGTTSGNYFNLTANGDTGANYMYKYAETTPGTANAFSSNGVTSAINQLYTGYVPTDANSSGYFGSMFIDIMDYSSTNKRKTWRTTGGFTDRVSYRISTMAGAWLNTGTAINSLNLTAASGNIVIGSNFALYGIRNA